MKFELFFTSPDRASQKISRFISLLDPTRRKLRILSPLKSARRVPDSFAMS